MPITLSCSCGKTLRVGDEFAGRRVKCPVCNAVILAPAPEEPAFEVVEDEPQQLTASKAKPVVKPRDEDDEDEGGSYKMTAAAKTPSPPKVKPTFRKRADSDDDDDDEDDRPTRRRRKSGAEAGAEAGRRLAFIIGGGFGLAIGVVLAIWGWNGEGRGARKLLIFGSIIAIAGLVSLVQGITGNLPDPE